MPGHHTKKEKRQARHIVAGYERRGAPKKKATSIAWATVTKQQNESWMFNGAGQPVFMGNQGNVSQFNPGGSVSPGQSYIPDEVAKMLVKESGLRKMDTVSKRVIEGYLESMRLSKGLAVDVAKVLRDVYGITPTFDESTLYARSGALIEELTGVVSESFPMPFAVDDEPKQLTEADVFALAIQSEFMKSTDENYDLVLGHLAAMSPRDLRDVANFYEWVGPEVFDYIESIAVSGPDGAAEYIVEGLCWPHRVQFMPEHIQALFDAEMVEDNAEAIRNKAIATMHGITPEKHDAFKVKAAPSPEHKAFGAKVKADWAKGDQQAKQKAGRADKELGKDLRGAQKRAKAAADAPTANVRRRMADRWQDKTAPDKLTPHQKIAALRKSRGDSEKAAESPSRTAAESPSRMKRAGGKAVELMKKVGGGLVTTAAHVAHHAMDIAGAGAFGFKKGYNRFNKDVDAKVANIHAHGSTKDPEPGSEGYAEKQRQAKAREASAGERKPGLISRALSHVGKFISNRYKEAQQRIKDSTPGHQASKANAGEPAPIKGPDDPPAKQRVANSGVGASESVLRSGSLLNEVEAAFMGVQPEEDPEDPELTPADVVNELDATTIVDMAALEAIGEMDWNGVAGIAGFMMLEPERFLGLIQSFKESTSAFRAEWSGLVESGSKPRWMNVGSFVALANLSVDEGVIPRLVYWAARTLQGADERVSSYVSEAYPELGKTVYGPAGDPKEGPRMAKSFMTPHPAGTMKPTDGDCTTRMFSDPDDREKERKSKLADVMTALDGMRKQAAAAGVPPEGMFLNLYTSLHTQKIRYS
jgi:hypothetical protein